MLSFTRKQVRHKKFDYQPRYFDPEKEKRNRRIKFQRSTSARRPNYVWAYVLLLAAAAWILSKLA